jgi:hypothetical protein
MNVSKLFIAALFALLATSVFAQNKETLKLDVSEDMNQFAFDQSRVYEDGMPAHGSGFVTRGYIYPDGTLNGSNGVNADGTPEFPEQVIGEWMCFGYMIGEAAHATSGAWVISTQIFNFGEDYGNQTIVTQGYELADPTPIYRAITGGTGDYAEASGQAMQIFQGLNASEGVVLDVELEIVTPATESMTSSAN